MNLVVVRDQVFTTGYTLGVMWLNGLFYGDTCEDQDRRLEDGNAKIPGVTAIPRGRYRIILSFSNHFQKIMPELLDVPDYAGVRIHGGNTAADTLGCILLGTKRIPQGVADCAWINSNLISLMQAATSRNEEMYLEIK